MDIVWSGRSASVTNPPRVEIRSTSSVPMGRRIEVFRDQVRETCGNLQMTADRDEFSDGTIRTCHLGSFRVALISADAHAVFRSRKHAASDYGYVYVTAPLKGREELEQDGERVIVEAGDVVTFDSSRPYALEMPEPFQMVAVRFPHGLVGLTPGATEKLTAHPWPGSAGVGGLVSQTLTMLGQHLTDWDDDVLTKPLGMAIGGLITTLFAERLHRSGDDPLLARQTLLLRIQAHARENLSNEHLTPAMLARKHNISMRYLQMLFAEQGTSPAKWIRDERLAGCYADLNNPHYDHLTVAAIGARWGLVGASQISRLFGRRYGITPREFRKQRQQSAIMPAV